MLPLILLSKTPPQADTLGAFAPLLGMMGLALVIAVLLNLWHFYDFDRRERKRRQRAQAPPPSQRRRRVAQPNPAEPDAAKPPAARSMLSQEPAEGVSALRLPTRDQEALQQTQDLQPLAREQPD